jgi:hypothetical protein
VVRLREVSGGRRDDGPFSDHNFAPLPDGLPNVVFAYEVGRLLCVRDKI